tara:strand:- start:1578 stop:2090 length:513 start_codon:yes stop_codon:yes gene_type:complete
MKRLLLLSTLFLINPVSAGVVHKITASAQGSVDGAYSHVKATPSVYSMSSTGITAGTMGHLDVPASSNGTLTGVAATLGSGSYTQTTAGAATSFTESYSQGSATSSAASLTHAGLTSLPTGNDVVSYAGGSNNGMSIAITSVSGGTITLAPGAAGTSVTGSITSALEIGN